MSDPIIHLLLDYNFQTEILKTENEKENKFNI